MDAKTQRKGAVGCSAWLGHPPRTSIKFFQIGNDGCPCVFVCSISFLLAFPIWPSPMVKGDCLVRTESSIKSADKSFRNKMSYFQDFGIQLGNFFQFGTEHKSTGRSGLNLRTQTLQETSKAPALRSGLFTESKSVSEPKANKTREKPYEDCLKHWWWLPAVFLICLAIRYWCPLGLTRRR